MLYWRPECVVGRSVDPMCFSGSGPTHFFSWIVYYCVCIQHDIDKSQISFTEVCKTLRTNSGLRAINSCLHLFWPQLCTYKACFSKHRFVTAEFKIFISPADCGVWTDPHFPQIYAPRCRPAQLNGSRIRAIRHAGGPWTGISRPIGVRRISHNGGVEIEPTFD